MKVTSCTNKMRLFKNDNLNKVIEIGHPRKVSLAFNFTTMP